METVKVGSVLILNKTKARKIARQIDLAHPHSAFEVTGIKVSAWGWVDASLKFSALKTSRCGICGLKLTDPRSVEIGIGPICAGRLGISWGATSMEELRKQLEERGEVITRVWASEIKEIINEDSSTQCEGGGQSA